MDRVEILAHIAAPSGFEDDRRYRAQAAAIADFESTTRLKVYDFDDSVQEVVKDSGISSSNNEDTPFNLSSSFPGWPQTDAAGEIPTQQLTRQLLRQNPDQNNTESEIAQSSSTTRRLNEHEAAITWKVTKNQTSYHNPAHKISTLHQGTAATPSIHTARTPDVPRPKTAPAASVPCNTRALRKRAHSDSSSFESLRSIVPDTQEPAGSLSFKGFSSTALGSTESTDHVSASVAQRTIPNRPETHQSRPAKRQKARRGSSTDQQPGTPNLAHLLGNHTASLTQIQGTWRVSYDSAERVITPSDSTSTWPPPQHITTTYPPPPVEELSTRPRCSAFHSISALLSSAEMKDGWQFSPTPSTATPNSPLPYEHAHLSFPSINALPTAIHAPSPPVGHGRYTTHLTLPLRNLATRLPLSTNFRPILVTRDINVLERGYWYLRIPVAASSGNPPTKSHVQDGDTRRARGKHWTEEAFLQTWRALAAFIQRGEAGWGVSLYRDEAVVARTPSVGRPGEQAEETQTSDIVLKVTCWGETVGHLYLVLWALSDKRTEGLGLEGRDAGAEAVIRMAKGRGERGGSLGEYGFKGGEGAAGRWGIIPEKN